MFEVSDPFAYTEQARHNDQSMGLPLIDIDKLHIDHEFNCRGRVSPGDVVDLAKDISYRGLQQGIIVRELRDNETELREKGLTHKIIAGHRRFTCYKHWIRGAKQIPCHVKPKDIGNFEERDINAIENIQSKKLNYQQEANALKHYWKAGVSADEVASRFSKSIGWVYQRFHLLELPLEIQNMVGEETINISEIQHIKKLASKEEQLRTAYKIRDKRLNGKNRGILPTIKKVEPGETKKHRTKTDIQNMMMHVRETLKNAQMVGPETVQVSDLITLQGNGIHTLTLAWASGELSTADFHDAFGEFCELFDIEYEHPEYGAMVSEIEKI
jgi:ParB/RepB/Spo0J family partition protein